MTSPRVAAEAQRLGVDVSAMTGTGTGGRISLADVRTAAGPSYRPPSSRAPSVGAALAKGEAWINPLVARARANDPQAVAEATRLAPAPTVFAAGDVPPFCASGMDPVRLLDLPAEVRHTVALAGDAAALLLFDRYAVPDVQVSDPRVMYGRGWDAYDQRVATWLGAVRAEAAVYTVMKPPTF